MKLSSLSAPLTRLQAMALVDAVMDRDGLALAAAGFELEDGEWVFEATCAGKPDIAAFEALAREVLGGTVKFRAAPLPETDWVARSQAALSPIAAGGFFIHASHHAGPAPAGLTPILIDAGQAFGTGHHATTLGCLEALAGLLRQRRPSRVLDLGCGTGILAIAIAKRLRMRVLACDIDPKAVAIARANARANQVGNFIVAVAADGLRHRRISEAAPFDLVIANILAGPLARLAPQLARAVAPSATIILGGLLAPQAARVIAAFADNDMVLRKRAARDGWATLTLERK